MRAPIDFTGRIFGRLTVVRRLDYRQQGHTYYLCKCACGKKRKVAHSNLRSGATKGCGQDCPNRANEKGN